MNKFEFIATGKITPILVFGFVDLRKKEETDVDEQNDIVNTGIGGGEFNTMSAGFTGTYERFQNSTRRQFKKYKFRN